MGPMSLNDLPDELLEAILVYLNYNARLILSLVSRRFCRLARTKKIHRGFVTIFQARDYYDADQFARWEAVWAGALENIELKDVNATENDFRMLEKFLESNMRLKDFHVHMSEAYSQDASSLFSFFTQATSKTVETFSVSLDFGDGGDGAEPNVTLPSEFLKGFPALKSLGFYIPDPNWESDLCMFSHIGAQLTLLDISTMSGSILNFAQNCPNLRRLSVGIPATANLSPLVACTNLERIHVVFGPEVDGDVNLDWVKGSRGSLKRLLVQKAMPDEEENPIFCVLPSVDMPVLEAIVADNVVSDFVPGQFPQLRYMEVTGCFFNTEHERYPTLDPLFAACPKLMTLRTTGTHLARVTNHSAGNSGGGGTSGVLPYESLTKIRFRENVTIEDQSMFGPDVFPNLAKVEVYDIDNLPITALTQCTTVREIAFIACGCLPTIDPFLPPSLTRLEVRHVLSIVELWPSNQIPCPDLREIEINNDMKLENVDALHHCSQLTSLTITGAHKLHRLWQPSGPHPLRRLTIGFTTSTVSLEALASCQALTYLCVDASDEYATHPPPGLLEPLRNLPLVHFEISGPNRFSQRARIDDDPMRFDVAMRYLDLSERHAAGSRRRTWKLDLSPLATWGLRRLHVRGLKVHTVGPVASCRELEILELHELAVGEYKPIEWAQELPNLVRCHVDLYRLCPEPHTQEELFELMRSLAEID